MIDLSDICRNSTFDQRFSVFFSIHLANLRRVKIVQKSGKFSVCGKWQPCIHYPFVNFYPPSPCHFSFFRAFLSFCNCSSPVHFASTLIPHPLVPPFRDFPIFCTFSPSVFLQPPPFPQVLKLSSLLSSTFFVVLGFVLETYYNKATFSFIG